MIERDVFLRGLSMIHSPGMLSVAEATFLYEFAASFDRPITWVELGVWCGRSYWSAGCGLPDCSTLIGVDEFSGILPEREGSDKLIQFVYGQFQYDIACAVMKAVFTLATLEEVRFCKRKTHDAAAVVPDGVDVLVVDAAHDYESVKQDLADWLPKMRPGGLVLCHDYTPKHPGVIRAVDEAVADGRLLNEKSASLFHHTRFARREIPQ